MDLAELNVKIGADLSAFNAAIPKVTEGLGYIAGSANKLNAVLDNNAKSLAKVTAASAATTGGYSQMASNANKLTTTLSVVPKGFDEISSSVSSLESEFNTKWNAIIANAERLVNPLGTLEERIKILQTAVQSFGGGVIAFKSVGAEELLNQSKLIVSAVNSIPTSVNTNFQLSGGTQTALQQIGLLSTEINDLGNGGAVSIGKINTALNQLRTASIGATNVQDIQKYDAAINKLKNDLSTITTSVKKTGVSLSTIGGGSNTATLAVTNFGRVLQDLPYGFIGIANNLNPVLEGFQRLSAESKAAGTSVSGALLKSLTGAGGLGLGLSVVTAALQFATVGMSFWTRGMGSNKKAVEDNKKVVDEYTAALNRSYEAAAQQFSQVSILVAQANKQNESLESRKKVVEDLNQVSEKYFGGLKIENGLIIGLSEAYEKYAEGILKVARAKAATDTIQKLSTELIKTADSVNGIDIGLTNLNLTLSTASKLIAGQIGSGFDAVATATQKVNDIVAKGLPTFEELQFLVQVTGKSENEINRILAARGSLKTKEAQLTAQIGSLSAFVAENDSKSVTSHAKSKESLQTVAKILVELQKDLSFLDAKELNEGLNESKEKMSAIEGAIKKLIDINIPADSKLIQKLFGDINDIKFSPANFKEFVDKLEKTIPDVQAPKVPVELKIDDKSFNADFTKRMIEFQKTIALAKKFDIILPLGFELSSEIDGDLAKEVEQKAAQLESLVKQFDLKIPVGLTLDQSVDFARESSRIFEDISSQIKDSFSGAFISIGESLGSGEDIFKGFRELVGGSVKAIGEDLVKLGTLALAAKFALSSIFKNPLLEIAIGIALTALGTKIQNSGVKLQQGGIVPVGFPNDTYSAMLSSNEAVIPLDRINDYIKPQESSTQLVVLETRLNGEDIFLSQSRVLKRRGGSY